MPGEKARRALFLGGETGRRSGSLAAWRDNGSAATRLADPSVAPPASSPAIGVRHRLAVALGHRCAGGLVVSRSGTAAPGHRERVGARPAANAAWRTWASRLVRLVPGQGIVHRFAFP